MWHLLINGGLVWLLVIPAGLVVVLAERAKWRLLRCTRRHLDNSTEVSLMQDAPDSQRH